MATSTGDDRTQRYRQTRERIIDQAAELFAKNGYASTGVAELGETADLARGALYYYIGSKESLLVAIHDRVMDPLLRDVAFIIALNLGAIARFWLISESLLRQIIDRRDHVWVFLHEYRNLQGENRVRFRRKRQEFERYLRDLLQEGIDEGKFDVDNAELATLAFLNLHNYTYQWIAGYGKAISVESLAQVYCQIFFAGILKRHANLDCFKDELNRGREALAEGKGASLPTEDSRWNRV